MGSVLLVVLQKSSMFMLLLFIIPSVVYVRSEQCSIAGCGHDSVLLNNGVRMPVVGLGTATITDQDMITNILTSAIMAGYRLIDTADSYENHQLIAAALGVVLPSQGLSRSDLFITTKIWPTHLGYLKCRKAVNRFLQEL